MELRRRSGSRLRLWAAFFTIVILIAGATTAAVASAAGSMRPHIAAQAVATSTPQTANQPVDLLTPTQVEPAASGWLVLDARQGGWDHLWAYRPGSIQLAPLATGEWNDRHPAISPDGTSIAFASDRDGPWDIYVLELASGAIRRVTSTPAYETWPSWSPDGRWLAVESYADGDLDIWVLSVDGSSQPIQLTNESGADTSPAWDPKGRRIAFVSDRSGQPDLYLADLDIPDDGRFLNLTQSVTAIERDPAFSPSGDSLAFSTTEDGIDSLMVMEMEPGSAGALVGQGVAPAWSPDGTALVASIRGPNRMSPAIYQIAFPGSSLASLPPVAAQYRAAWVAPQILPASFDSTPAATSTLPHDAPTGETPGRANLAPLQVAQPANAQLTERAVEAFDTLRRRVAMEVGWDLLSKLAYAFVGINDPLPPGWEAQSWLETGRAFSFAVEPYRAGWVEIVREDIGAQTYWRVFLRAAQQDGSVGEPLRNRPWDLDARYRGESPSYDQGGAPKSTIPPGYFIDFTSLAADLGFERLPALASWRRYYPGARFNEFVLRQGLSWEQAMLELYPRSAIATPTPFRTPTLTPTPTRRPTATPSWWRWRTPTPSPLPTIAPTPGLP